MKNPIWGILAVILVCLSSCTRMYDSSDLDCPSPSGVTYLNINIGALRANKGSELRLQGDASSINIDTDDREDYVRSIALLLFDSASGALVKSVFTSVPSLTITVPTGTYDFYFLANYSATNDDLAAMTRDRLDTYISTQKFDFRSFNGATVPEKYFPMARVYKRQQLVEGGTFLHPLPFTPTNDPTHPLKPISLFGTDDQTGTKQTTVNLIRSCARIDLRIHGVGLKDLKKVEYIGALTEYTLGEMAATEYKNIKTMNDPLKFSFVKVKGDQRTPVTEEFPLALTDVFGDDTHEPIDAIEGAVYVPERLFDSTEHPGWDRSGALGTLAFKDEPIGDVQYIQITREGGMVYRIPIVFDGDHKGADQSYLDYARNGNGAQKPDYKIVRNHAYHFDITISTKILVEFRIATPNEEELPAIQIFPTE